MIDADAAVVEAHSSDHGGACIWFTGLSGSGKSTTAEALVPLLEAAGHRVTVLDGDVVRTELSAGLGFSKDDRDANVRRIGFVAREIVRHGGLVVCAVVSPYRAARDAVRERIGSGFIEVFVDTPLEECASRDTKGLYAQARDGSLTGLTGVDDPYEPPLAPELVLGTIGASAEENARRVFELMQVRGIIL